MKDDNLLDDLAPKRTKRIIKKRFHSNKGVSAEVAARRQAAAEAAQENPLPKEQKDAILMKYGVKPAVIEREIKMPAWKKDVIFQLSERPTEVVWHHRMQDWYKETKGLTRNSARGYRPTPPQTTTPLGTVRNAAGAQKGQSFTRSNAPVHHKLATIRFKDPQKQKEHEQKYWGPKNPNSRRSSVPTDKSTKFPQS
jgi:hypothetical protein